MEVADLFEPAIDTSVKTIQTLIRESIVGISVRDSIIGPLLLMLTINQAVYLVGGFSSSPYMISQLKKRLAPYNITVSTPDEQRYTLEHVQNYGIMLMFT